MLKNMATFKSVLLWTDIFSYILEDVLLTTWYDKCIFLIVSCYPKLISLRLTTKMGICSLLSQISITHELLGITYWSNNIPPFILDRVDLQLKRLIDLRGVLSMMCDTKDHFSETRNRNSEMLIDQQYISELLFVKQIPDSLAIHYDLFLKIPKVESYNLGFAIHGLKPVTQSDYRIVTKPYRYTLQIIEFV
uniref:Uncharacterized protein n=1 Tax=Rhizophagus irregularis (strain DAOM 181602 / DAOM 197198 / MUCL 43194) TaxID=747089 RepID=U9U5Q2_RHIID